MHQRDRRQEGVEHEGKQQPLRNHLDAAVRPPGAVVLGGYRIHVAHYPREQRGEHELGKPPAHGRGDVVGSEKRHEVAVEEEHDRLRGRGGDHGKSDGQHAAEGDLAV